MKISRTTALSLLLSTTVLCADAVPAKRGVRTIVQPDGTTINVNVVGDEHLHFTTLEDGRILCEDSEGFFDFGRIDESGAVVSTGVRAAATANFAGTRLKDVDMQQLIAKRKSRQKAVAQTGIGLSSKTYPTKGSPKGLIILVEYSDVSFTVSNPAAFYQDMINGENFTQYGGTGSALKYFTDQSKGVFTPSFDVLGPVKLPQSRSYYGANDWNGDDQHPEMMVVHAVGILDSTVDFSKYDTDNDGYIDNVYVIYAGQGEASYGGSNTVWPHSWDVRAGYGTYRVDGKILANYACSNEWEYYRPDGIGTFVHEFSHVMGLPDLYSTTYNNAQTVTPGAYSVLDYGPYNNEGRTPPNYGAYERNALGWTDPIVMDGPMSVTLPSIDSNQFGIIGTSSKNEFFLFENRQQTGWDSYIPGHGMLIWHIDYNSTAWNNNTVNNTASHQYVDIEEANGNANNSSASIMAGWTFPGTSRKTEFTSSTKPALKTWANKNIDLPVTNITETNGMISFDVAGGKIVTLDAPEPGFVLPADGSRSFIASWDAVEGATDYYLTVFADADGGECVNNFDNRQLAPGWTANRENFYDTSTNFGETSPSFRFDQDKQTLTSPLLYSDVNRISFWNKGQGNNASTHLNVEGLVNSDWVLIDAYYPDNGTAKTTVYQSEIPTGVRQVRFTMVKIGGNIAVDDIVLSYGEGNTILSDYDGASTGGQTSVVVDKLPEDISRYGFSVVATDGKNVSAASPTKYVDLSDIDTGTESIAVDMDSNVPVEYYTLQGVRVENPTSGIYIRRQGSTTSKVLLK